MKAALWLAITAFMLAGCNRAADRADNDNQVTTDVGDALDQQAIARGILPDLRNLKFAGRFETRSELGTDKFCAIAIGQDRYRIGVLAVFGSESKCEGQGIARIDGEKVQIQLQGSGACSFNGEFDGVELRFPGDLEIACDNYCSDRASLAGTSYFMVDPGNDAAQQTLGRAIGRLCLP